MNAPVKIETQPWRMSAAEASALILARKMSVEELTRSCLARIAERDADVKAWAWLDPDRAVRKARELDKVLIHAGPKSRLHGIPFGVKDMIDTAEMPTTNNSPIYAENQPSHDANVVRIMKAHGAFVLGKTDTVEFAAGGRKALTRNPHDFARTPGGSSSGSGAAVGDYQVPIAFGTQTGGSHIRPASFNGCYGIKPTHNTISWSGARHLSPTLDTLGWYGRSVDDLIMVAEAVRVWGIAELAPVSVAGLKVGFARTSNWVKAEPATVDAMERARSLLAAAGAIVTDLELPAPFSGLNDAQRVVMNGEGRVQFLPDYLQNYELLHEDFRKKVENAEGFTPAQLLAAWDLAAACRPVFDGLFGPDLDVILTPSSCGEAPFNPSETTGDAVMNSMWTLLHVPTVNIPGHTGPNGLPVGVTLAGPRLGDARLLAISKAVAPVIDPLAA
ncbi:amidase [Prosthecomicrobium sp. N25]|uniref:amidase n=1 Tax=Prosthecomicrobium sp. N25 TaxID=3129254 RepID=UPI003077E2D7